MAINITYFQTATQGLDQAVHNAVLSTSSGWVSGLVEIASMGMMLYILFYGYLAISGKIEAPIRDLIWNMGRMVLIMGFVTNTAGLLDASLSAIEGIQAFLAGGVSYWSELDASISNIINLLIDAWTKSSGWDYWVYSTLKSGAYIVMALGILKIAWEFIKTSISLALLSVTAPLFIFCLMYGFLKNMFSQWLGAIIANCLKITFLVVAMKLGFTFLSQASDFNTGDNAWIVETLLYLMAGILLGEGASFANGLANRLSQVSIEGVAGSKFGQWMSNGTNQAQQVAIGRAMKMAGGAWGHAANFAMKRVMKKTA